MKSCPQGGGLAALDGGWRWWSYRGREAREGWHPDRHVAAGQARLPVDGAAPASVKFDRRLELVGGGAR